jgi:hypothetical protein
MLFAAIRRSSAVLHTGRTANLPVSPFRCLVVSAAFALGACASVPAQREGVFERERPLTTVADKRHRHIEQFVDSSALSATPRIALPVVRLADGAYGAAIAPAQATLVANHAARSVCLGLARYAELQAAAADGAMDARLVVTAIEPTSGAAAGASSAIGYFVPVPSRLPIGLGGLAVEAELRDPHAGQVALMRWARGANAVTQDAKMSSIGDAWQLAERFGKDFARALLDTDPTKSGLQRKRLPDAAVKANRALCSEHYGKLSIAGRVGTMLLPFSLGPGAIDPGPPATAGEL